MLKRFLRLLRRIPVAYQVAAFVAGRRAVVRGESMLPALLPGERILFDVLAYRIDPPRAGDIVLATHLGRPGITMIKRVAGAPGDEIEGRTLAAGEYWLLGDTPAFSTDSRELGPFRRADIAGRAWLVYWPSNAVRRVDQPAP